MPRLSLADLIASGRLPVGTELYHPARLHPNRAVTAKVVPEGIEYGGKVYPSPSAAARAAAGTVAENGWMWWRVKATRRTLSDLRSD
jgi:hypothetical protein